MTNDPLLNEKYRAQRALAANAARRGVDYLTVVEEACLAVFEQHEWKLEYAPRKGGFIGRPVEVACGARRRTGESRRAAAAAGIPPAYGAVTTALRSG